MDKQYETLNVDVPAEHLSELWRRYSVDRKCSINVSYVFDGVKADVFLISAVTTRDRHIVRSEAFYAYLDRQALNHAKGKFGLNNARPIADMVNKLLVDDNGKLKSCVEIAENVLGCGIEANPNRYPDNSTII